MGRKSKTKGKVGERELAAKLGQLLGVDAKRGQQYKGGPNSPDVDGVPGLHVECKRAERLHLWPAMQQAANEAGPDEIPIVFHRANRRPWVAIVYADDLPDLAQAVNAIRERQNGKL